MKSRLIIKVTFASLLLVISHATYSQDNFSLKSAKASIQGTSSLHEWESSITKIECTGLFQTQDHILTAVKSMEIIIKVEGIKSTKGKMMDNKTYDAFKSGNYPNIVYTFLGSEIIVDGANVATLQSSGKLSMAGVTNPITLSARGKVLANGDLEFTASSKIKMSDFKMKKPTAMMGMITVGDEVIVNFNLILTLVTPQAKKV